MVMGPARVGGVCGDQMSDYAYPSHWPQLAWGGGAGKAEQLVKAGTWLAP